MKVIQKYFLAVVPPAEIFERIQEIKTVLRDKFGIKYALKSPPHITLKMPFNYNEAKETFLVDRLEELLKNQKPIPIGLEGVGTFGNRVIYLGIEKSDALLQLQGQVKLYCKQALHLTDELSDRNFHPHLTVAFKDLKASHFSDVLATVKDLQFKGEFSAENLVLLRRKEGVWISGRILRLGG